ncbi:MAG: hypothetical protein GTN67_10610 [Hydrotalea flava]|uniref:hypothetical protein n=1 Tax=Hydrotalea TaxID=1004300 RepID=UPI0016B55A1F|nr:MULTISPECIES: hypothetical protein [Hydrotalea]NIM35799.1 hypothetical protein [Hydrotalea flava]NIM38649.1 hypothetical protein [Hydrotalea flava]NIN03833.1 hypothetical protein [Hydrotalea flava]NIN15527.1 hypothetical protein [Hydrotalea flava]NIO94575.1 hypothetical protein [Hydrotalea flava]
MKKYFLGFWYSLPVQLFLLHFRKYQILLLFWYILFATIAGYFMENFGANSLYLAPEYFDKVNPVSAAIVGFAIGIFIMSWNITTFILNARYVKFLATTASPFLKYCINNAVLPLLFLVFYLIRGLQYAQQQQLQSLGDTLFTVAGFTGGLFLSILFAFVYFFSADKTIYYTIKKGISDANKRYNSIINDKPLPQAKSEMRVDWFLSASFKLRRPRDIRHYNESFLDDVFSKHHIAAVIAILIAFIFLIILGFSADTRLFQIPAAASISVLFAVLIAVSGAVSLFFKSWSIPLIIIIYLILNYFYQAGIIDPRNKAYGLNYDNKTERPVYDAVAVKQLASDSAMLTDKAYYLSILNKWKARQSEEKPIMYIINTSGGGLRSAVFTMNTLQKLDSVLQGHLMQHTLFINGASGGLLGAAYFRELYYQKTIGNKNIHLHDTKYVDDVAKDLLNPLFSSFVTRDIIGPVQKFKYEGFEYIKDRGYAFEEKLNENTHGLLDKNIHAYAAPEASATIPIMFFNSTISRDARNMIVATHPARFLMRPLPDSSHLTAYDSDAIDFNSFFKQQNSDSLRVLSALRMNATFPFVLPNVWLPSQPIIDVMDAGLRDNFGQELTLRFLNVFKDWLKENTRKVIIIQLRDRSIDDWENPYDNTSLLSMLTKPLLLLQYNWFRLQDYYQHDALNYFADGYGSHFYTVSFQYLASKKDAAATLNFHLTAAEKKSVIDAFDNKVNLQALHFLMKESHDLQ